MESSNLATSRWEGKHVLICGINYWPEETGIAPYTTGLAEYLANRGAAVSIVTGMPYYPAWQVPEGYRGKLVVTEWRNGVTIHRLRQYVPTSQSAARRALVEASFMANAARLLQLRKPDVILGVIPSVCGGAMALAASKRFRVPYGVLVQDLSGEGAAQTGIKGGARVARLTSAIEGRILRGASAVAVIAEGFTPHVVQMGVAADRIHRVRNWTHIAAADEPRALTRERLGIETDAWVALHAGNMGFKQGLENVLAAASYAERVGDSTQFVFVGDGNQRAMLQAEASGMSNVAFFPPQTEADFPNVLAAADVLLVNQKPTVVDMCLPGKLTSYLAAERPVVAAVAGTSDTAVELTRQQAGLVVPAGRPEELFHAIVSLRSQPEVAAGMAARGRAFARRELTAERSLSKLDDFMASISPAP